MKKVLLIIAFVLTFLSFKTPIHAAGATFAINPKSGVVKVGTKFYTDVLINTNSQNAVLARAVITFDPKLVKVVKAENNASLFCSYPENQQSVDNTYGVIVLTGFCQSGVGTPYKTSGAADVFARIQFEARKAGTLYLDWEYSGKDEEFKSVIVKDGSPTTVILTERPDSAKFTLSGTVTPNPGPLPGTGFYISWVIITFGIIFIILGVVVTYISLRKGWNSKLRTVIVRE